MSWVDRVLAVPAIGIRFKTWFRTASDLIPPLEDLFGDAATSIDAPPHLRVQVGGLEYEDGKGLVAKITSSDFVVQFGYRVSMKDVPGEIPKEIEYGSPVQPYTVQLQRVEQKLIAICDALLQGRTRPVSRIGFVADISLDRDNPPPGVATLIAHLSQPWGELSECKSTLTAVLNRGENVLQRCHHGVAFSTDESRALTVKLDWQEVFREDQPMSCEQVKALIQRGRESALAYFEQFGKGDLRYGD